MYITGLNRYPDPHQIALKKLVCDLRNGQSDPNGTLTPENLFCGVGSDEAIDAVMRVFCKPSIDKIMICTPTYGMYKVCAAINEVSVVDVPLLDGTWQIDIDNVLSQTPHADSDCVKTKVRSHHQIAPFPITWQSHG